MNGIVIRRAVPADALALAALRWRFKNEGESVGSPPAEDDFVAVCAAWLRDRLTAQWRVWLAEVDGRACGQVFLCLVEKVPSPHPSSAEFGYVTNFYVTPEQRNRGLGRALLDEVGRFARDQQLDTLVVWPSERSVPLYQRCGFDRPAELLEQPVAPG